MCQKRPQSAPCCFGVGYNTLINLVHLLVKLNLVFALSFLEIIMECVNILPNCTKKREQKRNKGKCECTSQLYKLSDPIQPELTEPNLIYFIWYPHTPQYIALSVIRVEQLRLTLSIIPSSLGSLKRRNIPKIFLSRKHQAVF